MENINASASAALVVKTLVSKGLKISCAESCTGGLLMAKLVGVPSVSSVFSGGFVTYSEEKKCELLGMDSSIIKKYGVVSEQTAQAMAVGAAQKTGSDIGVGITGVAGPSGGTEDNPVGTVCFGFSIKGKGLFSKTVHFGDLGRNIVREKSADYALKELQELLG